MNKKFHRVSLLLVLDFVLVNVMVFLAYAIRFDFNYDSMPIYYYESIPRILIFNIIIKLLTFWAFKLYNSLWRYAGIHELSNILSSTFTANFIMQGLIFITGTLAPRSIFILVFLLDLLFVACSRFFYRLLRRILKGEIIRFKDQNRLLIIGAGQAGALLIAEIRNNPSLNMNPVAILDDDLNKIGRKINGVPIVGKTEDILITVNKRKIDEIIIAIPSVNRLIMNKIYTECIKTSCKIKILPSFVKHLNESLNVQKLKDVDIEDLLGRDTINLDIESISSYLKNKVVLITGGGGSIGSELCRQIATFSPSNLIILDNYENNAYDLQMELKREMPHLPLTIVIANVRDMDRMDEIFDCYKPEVVFHAAAHKHVSLMENAISEAIKNNVFGTLYTAQCANKYSVKKFVLISTDKAVNPSSIMGSTKRIAEMIIQSISQDSQTEYVAVRFGNVLGSNGSVIPLFKKQIKTGGPVTITHPEVTRYFMTIPEAVQLVIQAGAMASGGEIFVLDMGQPVKIYDLAINLIKLSGLEPIKDINIEYVGLHPGEKLYEELLLNDENHLKTTNDKIFVEKPEILDTNSFFNDLQTLKGLLHEKDAGLLKDFVSKMIIPYKYFQRREINKQ